MARGPGYTANALNISIEIFLYFCRVATDVRDLTL